MPRVQLKVKPAEEITALTARRPDDELQVLSGHQSDGQLRALLEAKTENPKEFLTCFEDVFSDILDECNVIGEYDEAILIQYEMSTPTLYHAGGDLGSLVEFPIPIRNGWLIFNLALPEEALAYLEETFDVMRYPYEITSVTRSYDPVELLTSRQQEFLTTAIEQGYYNDPRACTLTELAEGFGVNKSAASGVLHRAEGKAIKEFMGFHQ